MPYSFQGRIESCFDLNGEANAQNLAVLKEKNRERKRKIPLNETRYFGIGNYVNRMFYCYWQTGQH